MSKPIHQTLLDNYPAIALDIMAPLLDVLQSARDAVDGDLEKYLILLAIGVRTAEQSEFIAKVEARLARGEAPFVPGIGTNARSVADSLSLPPETVRRKVQELIAAGWIVREGRLLLPTAAAYDRLDKLRAAQVEQVVRHHRAVERLLKAQLG